MSEQDWIERLRERDWAGEPGEYGYFVPDRLWAAWCDVVEAAHIAYDGFGEDDHRFYGSQKRLAEKLAALRAEVEK